jgi:23S rRNA (adenine2030-N6)-methyltransferase
MNYRHGFHAGNFADVLKHLALVAVLLHLRRKETPFAVIDSHAGRGDYDLSGDEAARTGEAENGIARLDGLTGPEVLNAYLVLVAEGQGLYPGSPLIAAKLLRPQDRLVAVEKHPEEAAALRARLHPFRKATVEEGDGYARLPKLLPPPERRGLVLIDPPFEAPGEFERLAQAIAQSHRRFATGICIAWYPVKSAAQVDAFVGEVAAAGVTKMLRLELSIPPQGEKLSRTGLLVINPPYGFAEAMDEALSLAAPRLDATVRREWVVGEG